MDAKTRKKEYDRRRREEMKKNPQQLELMREKERLKYAKKKAGGNVKNVAEMTSREHRAKKKQWKTNSKKFRDRKKSVRQAPPQSPDRSPTRHTHQATMSNSQHDSSLSRKKCGRMTVKKNRSAMYRRIKELEKKLKKAENRAERYKKRYHKSEKHFTKLVELTPRTKVEAIIGKDKVSPEVRKRLLFGEVLNTELKESVKRTGKSHNRKKTLQRVVAGKVLKKYRMLSMAKKHCNLCYSAGPVNKNIKSQCQPRGKVLTDSMKNDVTIFLENDNASRMCPGKNDCITKHGVKKQKRLLSKTLQNLHKQFSETVSYEISYASFCRLKPFWIVTPKYSDRETCKCIIHTNTELIVAKLYEEKIFQYKNPDEVLPVLCCDSSHPKCLSRKCGDCKGKTILYEVPDAERKTTFKQWGNEEVTYLSKGSEKKIKKPIKKEVATTRMDLVIQLEMSFHKYMNHVANIVHQYKEISKVKNEVTPGTAVLHIDFSENYTCKCNEEIQSVHFGGGRQQITLHTGVLYSAGESGTSVKSFCSISPSLRHDTVAVWSHLLPVFQWVQEKENLHTVHILSDGAGSQYKNKTAFYIMSNFLNTFLPTIEHFTWNFCESGHGKGAPDGVGGCLKRSADRLVAEGKDVSNFETFVKVLEENCKGVKLFSVQEKEIESMEEYLQVKGKSIETFKGTLKVHQVVYCSKKNSGLQFRSLSCFNCQQKCVHFSLGEGYKPENNPESVYRKDEGENCEITEASEPNGCIDESGTKNVYNNITGRTDVDYSVGEWVLVNYDGIKYPGEITSTVFDHAVEVSVMHPAAGGTYKWPALPDRLLYDLKDVLKKISGPFPSGTRAAFFAFRDL